ncbi:MAG: NYN domain-containing protein [Candidatus Thermoplasmatota archaeon]|nr:NYN domain-containing protein [Candidatus Thermoplasmatota archaeon]
MDKKISLLIDGDNISPNLIQPILNEIQRWGDITIKRIYGDWTTNNMNGWKDILQKHAIRPIQQFRYGPNATDNALIMDAIDITYTNKVVNTFCVVTSDIDFYGLFMRLREYGYFVIGIGKQQTHELLRKSCDQFIFTENIVIENPETEVMAPREEGKEDLKEILLRTYSSIEKEEDGWVILSLFGDHIRRSSPDFDPRSYNHKNLISILRSYSDIFEVRNDQQNPIIYYVRATGLENGDEETFKQGSIKKFLGDYGFIGSDDGDYYFHTTNITKNVSDNKVRKGMNVRFKVFRRPDTNGCTTEEKNGKAYDIEIL